MSILTPRRPRRMVAGEATGNGPELLTAPVPLLFLQRMQFCTLVTTVDAALHESETKLFLCRGRSGDEMHDYEYTFANSRRRSNSNTQGLGEFKTKFEMVESEPVFEEDLHGPAEDNGDKGEALKKTDSVDTNESVTTEEESEIKQH